MSAYALARFTSPNAGVSVNQAVTDQYIAAAYGLALKNLDVNAVGIAIANAFTSAGSLDLSLASDTAGLKLPSKAGAIPTADGFLAFDTTNHIPVFGSNGSTGNFVFLNSANTTGSSFVLNAAAASDTAGMKVPTKAGAVPTADGFIAFDSTAHALVYGSNGSTKTVAATGNAFKELGVATSTTQRTSTSTASPGSDMTDYSVTVTPDGVHPVLVEAYVPEVFQSAAAIYHVAIQKDGSLVNVASFNSFTGPAYVRYRDAAPTNASHTYKLSVWSNTAQTVTFLSAATTEVGSITATQIGT